MTRRSRGAGILVAAGILVGLGAGCESAKVKTGVVEIEFIGEDGFVVRAKGYEEALRLAMEHEDQLSGDPDTTPENLKDWRRIISEILDAKRSDDGPAR